MEKKSAKKTQKQPPEIIRVPLPEGRVLIVDDMMSNLDIVTLLLAPYKLQVDTAQSGFEAIDIIKKGKTYDLIFMDHMMPKMDGIETTKKIRELGYEHPVFALTANTAKNQKKMYLSNGFNGLLLKPVNIFKMDKLLKKYISNESAEKEIAENIDCINEPPSCPPITIDGLNTETGFALYNGDKGLYISALRSFFPNAIELVKKLRTVKRASLHDYAINVHGLKSISSNIGALKLQKLAKHLEISAKSGNWQEITAFNKPLLEDAEKLVSKIQSWLEEFDSQNPKPTLPFPDPLLLAQLKQRCQEYDMDGIDKVMDNLENSRYDKDAALITWLREKITELEFDLIVERLAEYGKNPDDKKTKDDFHS